METNSSLFEPLLTQAEQYTKTSIDLITLKCVDKSADLLALIISRLLLLIVVIFFVFMLSIALALWLGDLAGRNDVGFLAVAAFFGVLGIFLWYLHPKIKTYLNNFLIVQMLN